MFAFTQFVLEVHHVEKEDESECNCTAVNKFGYNSEHRNNTIAEGWTDAPTNKRDKSVIKTTKNQPGYYTTESLHM